MTLKELVKRLTLIKKMGYVKTVRAHHGGVGNTLEALLGIKENNLRVPDIGKVELKAKRIDSKSMLTLGSRAPQPRGVNKILYQKYHHPHGNTKGKLYTTVYGSKPNNKGLKVTIRNNFLVLENPENIEAYWILESLDDVLKKGETKILLVLVETKGDLGDENEEFYYKEAYLLNGINFNKLKEAIQNDALKIDIRIGYDITGKKIGKYHDHGTGFRIMKNNYIKLFNEVKQLI